MKNSVDKILTIFIANSLSLSIFLQIVKRKTKEGL